MTKKLSSTENKATSISEFLLYKLLLRKPHTMKELTDKFKVHHSVIIKHIESLKKFKYNVSFNEGKYHIETTLPVFTRHSYNKDMWQGDSLKIGFVSDNHLGNRNERLDVLHTLYDLYADEGISTVFNTGNWIDGEARFNKNELHTFGMTRQVEYAVKHYPYRKGIKTKFIAGDDHEGWYTQREGIDIGEYFQLKREQAGLFDLEYMGYMEADIELTENGFEHKSWARLLHPGGGSAYALSYKPQKIVESYQGGEKPTVLFIGHYHKLGYEFPREVHTIQTGTTENQSIFMRKKNIQAMVGGGWVELRRAPDGTINRVTPTFITFYDNKFYIGKDKYYK